MAKKPQTKNLSIEDQVEIEEYLSTAESNKPAETLKMIKKFKPLNSSQAKLEMEIHNKDIVFVTGCAGTGKTFSALWIALNMLKDKSSNYRTIALSKSVVQIKDEEIGFIPGSEAEKLAPIMYSYTANINKIAGSKTAAESLMKSGQVEWRPIAFLRGCQFDNSIVILDEAQNLNVHCIKTLITRLGKSSKLIIMGDLEQYDRKNSKDSGLSKITEILKDSPYVGVVEFKDGECIRNPIITDVVKKLREFDL